MENIFYNHRLKYSAYCVTIKKNGDGDITQYLPIGWTSYSGGYILYELSTGRIFEEDLSCCICEECYNDFKELFNWKELDGYDIEWSQGDVKG